MSFFFLPQILVQELYSKNIRAIKNQKVSFQQPRNQQVLIPLYKKVYVKANENSVQIIR